MATGLRERKKQATREQIARVAMQLFAKRGFDAVTVAEVADAAGVSEKTVFNYFPVKEDLVFGGGEGRWAALLDAIENRPAGAPLIAVCRPGSRRYLGRVASEA